MKSWVTLCLVCVTSGAFAADKTPPPTAAKTAPPEQSKSAEPKTLTLEEDKAARQEPKNKKVDTKASETASKPLL
ncbi:hypothetical protein [Corallococcus terminator]|uniref:Uncharacterized protein n=1 Tax=Corallococcus terminator TaxID=2316733 RepID=A0A3A8H6J1_9BACT|nr:hypothetical protein [Corallococcus terminator]RKG66737.1 hypothetical protein D7V88_41415 [Corallococcus terminator]